MKYYMYDEDQDYEITKYLAQQEEMQQRDLGHLTGKEIDVDSTDLFIILKAVAIYQKNTYEPSVVKEAWDRFAKFAQEMFPSRFTTEELERIWKMEE